ncbi:hypothetical protein CsSME_00017554 [Camellia sinensis var. sinensis]
MDSSKVEMFFLPSLLGSGHIIPAIDTARFFAAFAAHGAAKNP